MKHNKSILVLRIELFKDLELLWGDIDLREHTIEQSFNWNRARNTLFLVGRCIGESTSTLEVIVDVLDRDLVLSRVADLRRTNYRAAHYLYLLSRSIKQAYKS